jgi:hypothetical protein
MERRGGRNGEEQKGIGLLTENSSCSSPKLRTRKRIVIGKAVMPYSSIRTVFVSNCSRDTGYPDRFFVVFLSPSRNVPERYFD